MDSRGAIVTVILLVGLADDDPEGALVLASGDEPPAEGSDGTVTGRREARSDEGPS